MVLTRHRADAEGVKDEDLMSLDDPPQASNTSSKAQETGPEELDDAAQYHPLFCLSNNVPQEYFEHLKSYTTEFTPWLEITTKDPYPESILAHTKADYYNRTGHLRRSPPPFLDWTPKALYDFHKELLRPLLTLNGRGQSFAHFTFLAVDSACHASPNKEDWEIIVCSDGADFHESLATGPRLKIFRQEIPRVMESLAAIETLVSAPSEVGRRCKTQLNVQPPAIFMGGPVAMREYKWNAIAGLPEPEGLDGLVEVLEG
ncbi:MAG: hypothetical protein M1812_002528 [Candelaria pacifica]|nr:MAG: hypothetical protein M1812_002528 [Candelaria pacifica]